MVAPATPYDAKGLLKASIRDGDPVVFIEHSLLFSTKGEVPEDDYVVPIGVSDVKRRGRDVTIVAHSRMTAEALAAAEKLAEQGIEAEVVDLRTLRPLDMGPVLDSVARTNRVVIAGEDWRSFGIGAEVAARIQEEAFDYLDAPVLRVNQAEVPLPYAANLEKLAIPDRQTTSWRRAWRCSDIQMRRPRGRELSRGLRPAAACRAKEGRTWPT